MENLKQIDLFSSLEEQTGQKLAQQCLWKNYCAHEMVLDADDESEDVRFVLSGRVRIIIRFAHGKETILAEIGEGEFFGELAAIDGQTRSAHVITLYNTKICCMPRKLFIELLETYPAITMNVLKVMAGRIRTLNNQLAEQSFLQAKYRLYAELLRLSKPRPNNNKERSLSPPPTQQELAERIGTRREVVSRELSTLQKIGIINKTPAALILCEVEQLQQRLSAAWSEAV